MRRIGLWIPKSHSVAECVTCSLHCCYGPLQEANAAGARGCSRLGAAGEQARGGGDPGKPVGQSQRLQTRHHVRSISAAANQPCHRLLLPACLQQPPAQPASRQLTTQSRRRRSSSGCRGGPHAPRCSQLRCGGGGEGQESGQGVGQNGLLQHRVALQPPWQDRSQSIPACKSRWIAIPRSLHGWRCAVPCRAVPTVPCRAYRAVLCRAVPALRLAPPSPASSLPRRAVPVLCSNLPHPPTHPTRRCPASP